MSYGIAKRTLRNGNKVGQGEIEGVMAPETAAHACRQEWAGDWNNAATISAQHKRCCLVPAKDWPLVEE
jgi:hypothetical protein